MKWNIDLNLIRTIIILSLLADHPLVFCGTPHTEPDQIVKEPMDVPMRDGVTLTINIYRHPDYSQPLPVLLLRTPYGQGPFEREARRMAAGGYISITQDSRGRFASGGSYPFVWGEGRDGFDTVEWIRNQPWCDGKIGMWGASYMGLTQWLAAAEGTPLDAMAPTATCADVYEDLYLGGAYRIAFIRMGFNGDLVNAPLKPDDPTDWPNWIRHLPLTEIDRVVGRPSPWRMSMVRHHQPDGFWKQVSASREIDTMDIPMQHAVGYYDFFCRGMVSDFQAMRHRSATAHSRNNQQLILGPWNHATGVPKVEDMDFGEVASMDPSFSGKVARNLVWFDRHLKKIGVDESFTPVEYFSMGENTWYNATDWPPAEAEYTPVYLHSGGRANTRNGDGRLERYPPSTVQMADHFRTDPADPIPSAPGREDPFQARFGPFDQQLAQDRDDVLVYRSRPMEESLRFAGPIFADFFVSADTPDADWVVMLQDLYPSGFTHTLASGIQRGSARDSVLNLSPMEPGRIYRIKVDLGHAAARIQPGHRLCIQIQGTLFPVYDRNKHTGEGPDGSRTRVSVESVHHSRIHPSSIGLPLMNDPSS